MGYDPEEATVDFSLLGSSSPAPRLLVVSMHLPVRVSEGAAAGEWAVTPSEGNVVRESLASLRDEHGVESVQVGWLGRHVPAEQQDALTTKLMIDHKCCPVYLTDKETEDFYYRFCKGVLWPTMNYSLASSRRYHEIEQLWATHKRILSFIADAITTLYRAGDVIWIHDYHLLCLPAFLRHRLPSARIGFFLHCTFPSSELFRQLPIRESILAALCKADVVGFQTYQFCRYFLRSVSNLLWNTGYQTGPVNVTDPSGRVTRTHVDPTGLPVDFYEARLKDPAVVALADRWRQGIPAHTKIVVGRCNRFDKYQGIVEKLLAFDYFLLQNPSYIERVVLIQLIIDGEQQLHDEQQESNAQSEEVHESRSQLIERVQQLVGHINGKHGTLAWQPIHIHIKQNDSIDHNLALYLIADVCLITPIRDGMNLIAHESVLACQTSHAPLILSEFAGAASCLGGSIIVNPYDKNGVSEALVKALEMGEEEKAVSHAHNWRYVKRHTSGQWAKTCLWEMIRDTGETQGRVCGNLMNPTVLEEFIVDYKKGTHNMLVLDAGMFKTSHAASADRIKTVLAGLAAIPSHTVFLMSAGGQETLDYYASIPQLGLCCSNGLSTRYPDQKTWETQDVDLSWRDTVRSLYHNFCERTPGTEIVETESALIWSYAKADQAFAKWLVKDLVLVLHQMADKYPIAIVDNEQSVECRPHNLTTGSVCRQLAARSFVSTLYYFGGRAAMTDTEKAFAVKGENGVGSGVVAIGPTSPRLLACDVGGDGSGGRPAAQSFQYCITKAGVGRFLSKLLDAVKEAKEK